MQSQSRHEASELRAIGLTGLATEAELGFFNDLLCMHPRCVRIPAFEREGMGRLSELAACLAPFSGAFPSSAWQRILKAELGHALLRTAAKASGQSVRGAVILPCDEGAGLEPFFDLFPAAPLIFILGTGRNPDALRERLAKLVSRGHPIVAIRHEGFASERKERTAQMLDFVRLPLRDFPWDRLENGCLNPSEPLPLEPRL